MSEHFPNVRIYTDGSCLGNPGPGGWSAIIIYSDRALGFSGCIEETTSNRMELFAILKALEELTIPCDITIFTDSDLAIGWLARGAKRNVPAIVNLCLSIEKIIISMGHSVRYAKVFGHSGNEFNEFCDKEAHKQARIAKEIICNRAMA